MRDRLRKLGSFTGFDNDGAGFTAVMASSIDPFKMMKVWHWRHAYLGRYGHQPIVTLANMPVDELNALVEELSDILKREGTLKSND